MNISKWREWCNQFVILLCFDTLYSDLFLVRRSYCMTNNPPCNCCICGTYHIQGGLGIWWAAQPCHAQDCKEGSSWACRGQAPVLSDSKGTGCAEVCACMCLIVTEVCVCVCLMCLCVIALAKNKGWSQALCECVCVFMGFHACMHVRVCMLVWTPKGTIPTADNNQVMAMSSQMLQLENASHRYAIPNLITLVQSTQMCFTHLQ